MVIYLAPIKEKKHEWKPKQNDFYWQETLDYIFKEEQLDKKESYKAIHDVRFNAQTLTFENINYVPQEKDFLKKSWEIFYVKTPLQKVLPNKDETGYWCYVSSFEINNATTVTLSLTIDTLSSSLVDFQNNRYAGECYTDRTNNRVVEQNLIHPDVCASIQNQVETFKLTSQLVNRKVDTFIISFLATTTKKEVQYPGLNTEIEIQDKGIIAMNVIPPSSGRLQSYQSILQTDPDPVFIKAFPLPTENQTIGSLLKKHNSINNYEDPKWYFKNQTDFQKFVEELVYYNKIPSELFRAVDETIKNPKETIQKWISIPKIFNFTENPYSKVEIDLTTLGFSVDKTNHAEMHKNYFLVFKDLFKIPLDPLKLKNNIYVERVVSFNGIIYKFYFTNDISEPFHSLNVTVENGLPTNENLQYQKNLNLAYETGQKADISQYWETAGKLGTTTLAGTLGVLIAASTGGKAIPALLALSLSSNLVNTGINKGFSAYRENQQIKYEQAKIDAKPNESKNILKYESFIKTVVGRNLGINFCWFKFKEGSWAPPLKEGYGIIGINEIANFTIFFGIETEEPTKSDIEIIETDQKIFGAVQNRYELNCQNPLVFNELTTDHLFWKGRILPTETYVNSFWIENLNEVLSQGVMIRKKNFN